MENFATSLSETALSQAIQRSTWIIPAVQSVHILAIGMLLSAVLFLNLHLLGFVGGDSTLAQTRDRFRGWVIGALIVLLATGSLLIIGEPARQLLSAPFWTKMVFLIGAICTMVWLFRRLAPLEKTQDFRPNWASSYAALSFVLWVGIVTAGRLIAYVY